MSRDKAGDSATGQAEQGIQKKNVHQISAKALPRNKQLKFTSGVEFEQFGETFGTEGLAISIG